MNKPVAWINGHLLPLADAAVPVWDLGVVAGAAVTEMARTVGHQPFRLDRHLARLTASCRALGFSLPCSTPQLLAAVELVVHSNRQLIRPNSDLGIVAFVTAGTNATYLAGQSGPGTVGIHTFELPFSQWKTSLQQGVRLRIPSIRQIPAECLDVSHKVRNRLHWWLADREASQLEPGSRALLLSRENWITETSTACFYGVIRGQIVTSDRLVLDSLSRQLVEELATAAGLPFVRRAIEQAEIADFEEAFVSSTPCGLLPVSHIDGHPVGTTAGRSVLRALQDAWNQRAGMDLVGQILSVETS